MTSIDSIIDLPENKYTLETGYVTRLTKATDSEKGTCVDFKVNIINIFLSSSFTVKLCFPSVL